MSPPARAVDGHPAIKAVALIILCFIAHGWTLGLDFFADDWEFLRDAATNADDAVLLGRDSAEKTALRLTPVVSGFFRPIHHLILVLECRLVDTSTFGHHLLAVLTHALATILLFVALRTDRRFESSGLAFVAAALFAVYPTAACAVAWVSAAADVWMTIGFLSAWIAWSRYRATKSAAALLASLGACAFSVGCKETGLFVPPLILVIDLLGGGDGRRSLMRRVLDGAALAAVSLIGLGIRVHVLGERAFTYTGHERTFSSEIIERMFSDSWRTILRVLGGDVGQGIGDIRSSFVLLAGGAVVIAHVGFVAFGDRSARRRLAMTWLLFAATLLPALRFLHESLSLDPSRLFYLPMVFGAIVLAEAPSRFANFRPARWVAVAMLAAAIVAGYSRQIPATNDASSVVTQVRRDVAEYVRRDGDDMLYVFTDLPLARHGVPLFFAFEAFAFRPPFVEKAALCRNAERLDWYLERGELSDRNDLDARVVRWNEERRRLEAVTGLMPRPDGSRHVIVGDATTAKIPVEPPVATRGIAAFDVRFDEAPRSDGKLEIELISDEKVVDRFVLAWQSHLEPKSSFTLRVGDRAAFILAGTIDAVVVLPDVGTPPPREIEFSSEWPRFEITGPPPGATYSLSRDEPIFRFPDTGLPIYRLEVLVPQYIRRTFRARDLDREGGDLVIPFSRAGQWPDDTPTIPWLGAGAVLDRMGVTSLTLGWRIRGFHGQDVWPEAESKLGTLRIVR